MSKDTYKVRNWREYNRGLRQRGAITIWISQEVVKQWRYQGEKKKGGQFIYSALAIEVCLTVRKVYHLGYRQTQGFMESFFQSVRLKLPVPDYTVMCRRSASVLIELPTKGEGAVTNLVVDSTGLKVYGEGEWKVRKHGWGKHRTWMKLHVALDAEQQSVEAVELTTNQVDDGQVVGQLVGRLEAVINSFTGDAAYDQKSVREYLYQKARGQTEGLLQCIPPRHHAVPDTKGRAYLEQRNEDIAVMWRRGRKQWKLLTNYHQRSKVETFMFRYKIILGSSLQAREPLRQQTEVTVGCKILNRMLQIAKPKTEKVA